MMIYGLFAFIFLAGYLLGMATVSIFVVGKDEKDLEDQEQEEWIKKQ